MEIGGFYREVIQQLDRNDVSFLLVAGDMDLWLDPPSENLYKFGKALVNLNYSETIVKDILDSRPVDHPTPIRIFSEDSLFKVDLMTTIFMSH